MATIRARRQADGSTRYTAIVPFARASPSSTRSTRPNGNGVCIPSRRIHQGLSTGFCAPTEGAVIRLPEERRVKNIADDYRAIRRHRLGIRDPATKIPKIVQTGAWRITPERTGDRRPAEAKCGNEQNQAQGRGLTGIRRLMLRRWPLSVR